MMHNCSTAAQTSASNIITLLNQHLHICLIKTEHYHLHEGGLGIRQH